MQQRTRPGGGRAGAPARATGARVRAPRAGELRAGESRSGEPRSGGRRGAEPRTGERGRAPTRPMTARRTAAQAGAAKRTRAPEPRRLTGRAMVLGLVLVGLLLAYAYPVRVYLAQQAEIVALEHSQASQQEKIERLRIQSAKWNDPEYVKSQARSRLYMVLPGEKPMVVVDPASGQSAPSDLAPSGGARTGTPWYGKLYSSIVAANQ